MADEFAALMSAIERRTAERVLTFRRDVVRLFVAALATVGIVAGVVGAAIAVVVGLVIR